LSLIPLAEAKAFLDVIHTSDDAKLQALLDGAEQEALDFMNRVDFTSICPYLPEDHEDYDSDVHVLAEQMSDIVADYGMPASVRTGILMLLQASYQAEPDDQAKLRRIGETFLFPYRCGLGI
jgi:hypothetical protein